MGIILKIFRLKNLGIGLHINHSATAPLLLGEGSFLNNLPHKNIQEDGHFGVELILPIDKNIGSIE